MSDSLKWIVAVFLCVATHSAVADRVKDLTSVGGVRSNQLVGYGLVTGLAGTGDGKDPTFTGQSLKAICLLYTSPSPRDRTRSRMPSSA